jgi:hypothetical protein
MMRWRTALVVVAILLLTVGSFAARRNAVVQWVLPHALSLAAGADVSLGSIEFDASHLTLQRIAVTKDGEPLFAAARIDVAYDLRDLLPGSRHRFGLRGIAIDRPVFTLVRHNDGSYNLALGGAAPSAPVGPQWPNRVPIAFTVRVRDGAVALRSPHAFDAQARRIDIRGLQATATIDSTARTRYRLTGAFVGSRDQSFAVAGTIDPTRGYAMHRVTARGLPLRPIADFFLNTHAVGFQAGQAHDLDLRLYALNVEPDVPIEYHLGGRIVVDGVSMRVIGLNAPVHDIHAEVQVSDGTLFFNGLRGVVADMPLRASGSIFGLDDVPQMQIGVSLHGNLSNLRKAFPFAQDQPIAGNARIGVVVKGPVDSPYVLAGVDATRASYEGIVFDTLHAKVAYHDSAVMFLPLEVHAQGADFTVRGSLTIGDRVRSRLMLHVDAPASALPYAGEVIGNEPLVSDILLDGEDTDFLGYGALASKRGIGRVAAVVHMERGGILDIAPLRVQTARGTIDAGYHLDRTHDASAFWLIARGVHLRTPARQSFLSVVVPPWPPIDGTVDEAAFVGGGRSGERALIAGTMRAHATTIQSVAFDALHAQFAGTLGEAAIDPIVASGSWGTFNGTGSLSLDSVAFRGHYHGTLQGLQPFFGGAQASGSVDGIAAVALASQQIIVQADDIALHDARIHGIPISHASGTLGLDGANVRLYNVRARVAGGEVIAAGTYDRGISLVATNLQGSELHDVGLPLDGGLLDADGNIAAGAPLPHFNGGVSLARGRVQQFAVAGTGLVRLSDDGAQLDHVVGGIDGIYALVSGDLSALSSGSPAYRVKARVPAGDLGRAIASIGLPSAHSDGTFNASLDVTGVGFDPSVSGPIEIPGGSVNGLPFIDARGAVRADRNGVTLTRGAVTVASTHVTFSAAENPYISSVQLRSDRADLSDFDNFFDAGDALAGDGRVRFDVVSQGHRLSSNADIAIAGLRYRNLSIGNTTALWSSRDNVLAGSIDVQGAQGALRSHGSIALARDLELAHVLQNSRYALTAELSDLDLSTWVAALGYPQVPITGRVDGRASVDGRFPLLHLSGSADLQHGTVGHLPIDRAALAFSSKGDRIKLDSASLTAPGLAVRADGDFGFRVDDPISLSVYANSSDVAGLIAQIWRVHLPVSGTFESTFTLSGTLAKPAFEAAFDASDAELHGVAVSQLFGSLELRDRSLVLHDAGVELQKGTISIEGSIPIALQSLGTSMPANAPVSFGLTFNQVDPSALDALLGNGTKLGGLVDGEIGIAGTVGAPSISGRFSIAGGSYASDLDRVPITGLNAALTFDRQSATLDSFKAQIGSGTLTAVGGATFPNGFLGAAAAGTAAFHLRVAAHGAQLDLPQFGSGQIDADVAFSRVAGGDAKMTGSAALSNALLPFAAFIAATQPGVGTGLRLPTLDLDLQLDAGKNVRVRGAGYGAGLDIGATGGLHLAGSLADPAPDGKFTATSGTLTYFDRAFRVQQASVVFDPAKGIIPTMHATGTTRVSNPDPNTLVNPYGTTDVTVAVEGPVDDLRITFSSNPPGYSNQQILAMIAPFGGLINGLSYSPVLNQGPNNTGLGGLPLPAPQGASGTNSAGTITAGQEAFDLLNAQFAAGLLSPLEGALSQGLGFQNVNVSLGYGGNVAVSASRFLNKTVNFVYETTFGIPERTSFGLQLVGAGATSAQLSFFFLSGPQVLFETPVANTSAGSRLSIGEPLEGQSGFTFTLQRLFW